MMRNHLFTRVLAALCLFCTAVLADPPFDVSVNTLGSSGNITVALNVPSNSSDDLYFHFTGPTSQSWIAFGFGNVMAGSLMFIAYPAEGSGNGITLSPRIATGETLPQYTDSVKVDLLNGTTIANGVYIVNAHCTGCRSWSGKTLDTTSTQQNMIYAVGPSGQSFQSNDTQTSSIKGHAIPSGYGKFNLDLAKATGDAGVPVLTSNSAISNPGNSNGSGDDDFDKSEIPIVIHGIFTSFVFLFILPGGYLFLRVFDKVLVHAGFQTLGVVGLIAGVAAGIAYNVQLQKAVSYHQVLGSITTLLVLAAMILGAIGHRMFKARGVPSPLMKFHRIVGPASIVFGWITVITGFVFRGEPRRIAPFVVVLLAVIIFVGGITFIMKKRKMRKAAMVTPAAQNFNDAYYNPQAAPPYNDAAGYYAPGADGMPMQTFNHPPGGHYDPNLNKAPNATTYEAPPGRP